MERHHKTLYHMFIIHELVEPELVSKRGGGWGINLMIARYEGGLSVQGGGWFFQFRGFDRHKKYLHFLLFV